MTIASQTLPRFVLSASEYEELLQRFVRYAKVHTSSREDSETFPSTPWQWDLLRLLKQELLDMKLAEVELDEKYGYLYATLPATVESAPTVGFIAHVDTYPSTPG